MTPVLVHGMMGLGDNVHQRAVIRQLMERHEVWLETVWPSLYHDLVGDRLKLVRGRTTLRTQAANAERQAALFTELPPESRLWGKLTIGYDIALTRRIGVLPAMLQSCGCDLSRADFSLPVPEAWRAKARLWLGKWRPHRPPLIYRPLVERTEWTGCPTRNPDHDAYARLFEAIARDFFVVSVADLASDKEWTVGHSVRPDVTCHRGELDTETLAALMAEAAMVFCSPGFALVLAQAVGTRVACIFGGHESARHYVPSALYAPFIGIDPIDPCGCFDKDHACRKHIDLDRALPRLRRFAAAALRPDPGPRPSVRLAVGKPDLSGLPTRFMPPGDLEALIEMVRSVAPRTMIEFGVNEGRTAKAILRNVRGIESYVGIDVMRSYVPRLAVQRGEVPGNPGHLAADDPRFKLLLRARGSFDLTDADLPACDAVFIDGDHSRAGVEQDYALARAVLRPGGIIIFHDDHDQGTVDVRDVLDDMHANGETAVHVEGTWLAFQRV